MTYLWFLVLIQAIIWSIMKSIKSYKRKEPTKHEKTSLQAVQSKSYDELRYTSSLNRRSIYAERSYRRSLKCESRRVSAGISFHTTNGRIVAVRASIGIIFWFLGFESIQRRCGRSFSDGETWGCSNVAFQLRFGHYKQMIT